MPPDTWMHAELLEEEGKEAPWLTIVLLYCGVNRHVPAQLLNAFGITFNATCLVASTGDGSKVPKLRTPMHAAQHSVSLP
jgi:hypothetical protein